MNLQDYLAKREAFEKSTKQFREICLNCRQPNFSCFCEHIKSVDCKIKFVILIHPIEMRRRIATGRMAHLCLENSVIQRGLDFSKNYKINQIVDDPNNYCVVLYPGRNSTNISTASNTSETSTTPNLISHDVFAKGKTPVVFVIDGTWGTSRKMVRLSQNINCLPRICFTPNKTSQFKVRKQPKPECLSTIEAIHYSIELLGASVGFDIESRQHDRLLHVFDKMVERQIEFIKQSKRNLRTRSYRGGRTPHIDANI